MKVLRELRTEKKLTQEDLAKLLGVDRSSIARWETSETFPHAKVIYRIAQILGCSTDVLLRPDVEKSSHITERKEARA